MPKYKRIDERGRLALGPRFANKMVQVREQDGNLLITVGRFVPEREAWLHDNPEALAMVRRGLAESAEGAPPAPAPDLEADARLVSDADDEVD